jgi:hypothetical protein
MMQSLMVGLAFVQYMVPPYDPEQEVNVQRSIVGLPLSQYMAPKQEMKAQPSIIGEASVQYMGPEPKSNVQFLIVGLAP